ncbi:unnamed protein product [Caenorhabditis brenneri]
MENREEIEKKEESSAPDPVVPDPPATEKPTEDGADDTTVTVGEILEDLDHQEKVANMLFANQNASVCTFPEGYKPRQPLFACLTCTPAPTMAGVCYGCSLNCHDGHNIVELYTKRKFKCDCGNSKFGDKKCTLYEEKDPVNEYNSYNHNYHGKFCSCDVFYPEDDSGNELLQCEICEDWFHDIHVIPTYIQYETERTENSGVECASMICTSCSKKLPFLSQLKNGKDVLCHSKLNKEQIEETTEPKAFVIEHFRKKLCRCADCTRVYDLADCEFLMEEEDDITKFEKDSKDKIAAEPQPTEADEMRELVREVGMDGAQRIYEGVDTFKRKFTEFFGGSSDGGRPVSVEDVKRFTESLKADLDAKRARMQ